SPLVCMYGASRLLFFSESRARMTMSCLSVSLSISLRDAKPMPPVAPVTNARCFMLLPFHGDDIFGLSVENICAQFHRIADCRFDIVGLNAQKVATFLFVDEEVAALQLSELDHMQAAVDALFLLLFSQLHPADRIEAVGDGLDRLI